MLRKLLKFELSYHIKSVGFWLSLVVMMGLGLLASTDWLSISASGGAKVKLNGALPIALNISALSIACIFFGAVFVVNGVLRDDTYKSVEVIHATPVKTSDMVLSRMIAAWLAVTLCLSAIIITMMAGPLMPWADKEAFGPINPLYYLHPVVFFIMINALFITAIFTSIAVLTRDKAMVYVSAVGLLILYFIAGALAGDNAPDWYGPMVDPFGTSALAEVTQFWPAAEQNSRLTPLFGYIGLNRLIWGGIGLGLFALSFLKSTRGIVKRRTKKNKFADVIKTKDIEMYPVTPKLGLSHDFSSFGRRLIHEFVTTIRSTPFVIMMGIFIALFGIVVWGSQAANPDPTIPTSTYMAGIVLGSLALPVLIVMVFFGGDIIWREKASGIHEILDATPVSNSSLLWAKWLALTLVLFSMILVGIIFGMITQAILSGGRVDVNPLVYFKTGLLAFGVSFTLQAFLVMFIQNFMPNRVVGMLVAAGVIIAIPFAVVQLPFYHPLMSYGSVSPGGLSEMSGYADLSQFRAFGLYWGAFAIILAVLSIWMYRRGLQTGLLARLRKVSSSITVPTAGLAVLGLAGFIGTGLSIHGSYEDGNYRNKTQREKRSVAYEELVKPLEDDPQPNVIAVKADVQFYPDKREAVISGELTLTNPHTKPLEQFYLRPAVNHKKDNRRLAVLGAARLTTGKLAEALKEYNTRIIKFDTPLAPGASTVIDFETYFHPPKLGDGSIMVDNGTFVNNGQVFPQIGIARTYMRNPDTRRKYDLPEREEMPERTDQDARQINFFDAYSHYVDFEATVCTDADQIGIAPGELLRTYEVDNRSCRDYKSNRPIANFFSFLSGDYTVAKDEWTAPDGTKIPLEIFHYKSHDYNVPLMLEAMKDSFKTFTREYGPYQYSQLRIVEFPYRSFAQSFAGTVPFSENIGFMRDPGDPDDNKSVDLATYVTMHEIGHQWFGHQIMPAQTVGFNVLSEGLTENAAMTAYEEELGWQKARRVLEQRAIQSYLVSRAMDSDDEPPLAKAENQQYLVYNKASWVFWGLKQYMGEEKMQSAIRKFVVDYGQKGKPYPTTLELTQYLRDAAGPDYDQLITDYWDRITFWDLAFAADSEPETTPNAEGGYDVTVQIQVDKLIASEEDGKETSVAKMDGEGLNEWIEIGLYTTDPEDTFGDEWLKLERVRVTDENSLALEGEDEPARIFTATITVDKAPTHVVVDPRRLLIERNVKNNVTKIDGALAKN